eukprot:TRINITY_DN8719_c0_g1_i4.p1 TRINITY_DN8719_c0_g1~~TRINITY_DN8719_c0_g1_i4.p1  ORF type:complete len:265 (-),score=50.32 TRINITY_DN8719_c0_g1_i4:281-1015(-)
MVKQDTPVGSHPRAANRWYAVWCHEHAYKEEMLDTNKMLSAAVRHAGGTLVRKRNPKMFHEWWLNTEGSTAPYMLIMQWRETKPCFDFLKNELSQGHFHKMPQSIYVVAETAKSFRSASSWASCEHRWDITVAPEMTADKLKAWLSASLFNGVGGVSQHGPDPQACYDAASLNQEPLQGSDKRVCLEPTSPPVPALKIDTRSAKSQFPSGNLVVADLVEALQNPRLASRLESLLLENMPENYTD